MTGLTLRFTLWFALVLAVAIAGCATAERSAVAWQMADVGSTGVALVCEYVA